MSALNPTRSRQGVIYFGAIALLAVSAASAQVASGTTGIDTSGSYRQEMRACLSGRTQEDQATCLKETRNAHADKTMDNASVDFKANAAKRCDALQGEDNAACRARVLGYGEAQGSVAGGGVLSSVETVTLPPGAAAMGIVPKTTGNTVVIVPAR